MKLEVSAEIREFLHSLAPEPRRIVSRTLDSIESGNASMDALQEPLETFYKVKAGKFRIICAVDKNTVFALFAERRSVIYETATAMFLHEILKTMRG